MKTILRVYLKPLLASLLVLTLAGCGPDDGSDGAPGAPGAPGADGQDALPLAENVIALNPEIDLSNAASYDPVTDKLKIHFFLTDGKGNGVDVTEDAYELRIYGSELIPDPTTGIDALGAARGQKWSQLLYERGTPATDSLPGVLTLVDAETGEYTYVCDNTVPASDHVHRVTVQARWRETIAGMRYVFANPVNASYDFYLADPATELASSGADMVLTGNCESCHGDRIGDVGHGGQRTEVKTCNHCHNLDYMAGNGGEGDLAHMIHRIHNGGAFDEIKDHGGNPVDFSEVVFPQSIANCAKCHGGAPDADLHYEVPTIKNCTSCHDDVTFAEMATHPGGAAVDGECANCHKPGGLALFPKTDIEVAHDLVPEPEDTSEYAVTIELLDPGTGLPYPFVEGVTPPRVAHVFMPGEQPIVRVTLAGANPVDYGANQDAEGDTDGELSTANLYVYGPRADAVPVLTTNSTTDGGKQQGHSLFLADRTGVPTTDAQVMTDATGYKYELMDAIDQLADGTYMIRFEGLDYDTPGAPSDPEYVTASSGLINFQVGTADEEHKVAGDACMDACHGDSIQHLTGAHPHHVPFNTDHCLGCHDLSDNYAEYIGNRVHAIHSASVTGDLHDRDWSEVAFPQEVNNCTICHTNPDPAAPVWTTPDAVACGGCHGANPDAVPADYPDADPQRIILEAAAATHMLIMGGDFDPTTNPQTQCIVCHGEGRIADLYDKHRLVTFPPLVEDDPS